MAKKKETSTAMTVWEDELAALAEKDIADMPPASETNTLSFAQGVFSLNGEELDEDVIRCVILDYRYENVYYDQPYDPDNLITPVCYAIDTKPATMKPVVDAPVCQNCAKCPYNQFGSADNGKGKKCRNVIRLALVSENSDDIITAKVSPTSSKKFLEYVRSVILSKKPLNAVITEISLVKDRKYQYKVIFREAGIIDKKRYEALRSRIDTEVKGILERVYTPTEEKETAPKKKAKGNKRF